MVELDDLVVVGSVVGLEAPFEDPLSFLPEILAFFFKVELQNPATVEHPGVLILAEVDDLEHDADCLLSLTV